MENRQENRQNRENAARKMVKDAVDKDVIRAALKAASGKEAEDEAVNATSALLEDRLVRIAARAADSREERNEGSLRASHIAVAAQREAEDRMYM